MLKYQLNRIISDCDQPEHKQIYPFNNKKHLSDFYKVIWYSYIIDKGFKCNSMLKGMDRELIEFVKGCETVVIEIPAGIINHPTDLHLTN